MNSNKRADNNDRQLIYHIHMPKFINNIRQSNTRWEEYVYMLIGEENVKVYYSLISSQKNQMMKEKTML